MFQFNRRTQGQLVKDKYFQLWLYFPMGTVTIYAKCPACPNPPVYPGLGETLGVHELVTLRGWFVSQTRYLFF